MLLTTVTRELVIVGVAEPVGSDNGGAIALEGGLGGSDTLSAPEELGRRLGSVLGGTGDGYEGQGRTGPLSRGELEGGAGGGGDETPLEGRLVITVVTSVVPERKVVVKTVAGGCVGSTLGGATALVGRDEMTGVSSGVLVGRVMS
jgi:hypothetical protein